MKFRINFTSCGENGKEIAQGAVECNFCHLCYNRWNLSKIFTPTHAIQINTMIYYVKVSDLRFASMQSNGFLLF